MDKALQALADPIRRRILQMLVGGALPAGRIASAFAVSRPAVSRHLRVLREAGLVLDQDSGRERLYRLDLAPLKAAEDFLAALRTAQAPGLGTWERRLMALDTEVHRVQARRKATLATIPQQRKRKTA